MTKPTLKKHQAIIDKALNDLTEWLEGQAIQYVTRLGNKHPGMEISFLNAMGVTSLAILKANGHVDTRRIKESTLVRLFEDVENDYGFGVLPIIHIHKQPNKPIEIRYTW